MLGYFVIMHKAGLNKKNCDTYVGRKKIIAVHRASLYEALKDKIHYARKRRVTRINKH